MTRRLSLVTGAVLFGFVVMIAIFAPWLSHHDPSFVPEGDARLAPGSSHWFGTDQEGRDVFARVAYGARTSLGIGLGAAFVVVVVGVVAGSVAGYFRGRIDGVLMRLAEVFFVIPGILLSACFVIAFGRSAASIAASIGLATWPQMARVTRAAIMQAKQPSYVDAARVLGASGGHVLVRHVLPQVVPTVVTLAIVAVATAILTESALSFLAIGIVDPTPSWGAMITSGRRFLSSSPHIVLFPAGAIFITVFSLFLISDGLRRDALQSFEERKTSV